MKNNNIKITEMFIKDLLDLYSKYMLLGVTKVDMCGILLNTLAGLYMTMVTELDKEEDDDETVH